MKQYNFDKNDKLIIIFVLILAILLSSIVLVLFVGKWNNSSSLSHSFYQTTARESKETNSFQSSDSIVGNATSEEDSPLSSSELQNTEQPQKSKKELVNEYVNAVNKLKNTPYFSMQMSSAMNVQVNEITGGSIAERILQSFVSDANKFENYSFVNGVDNQLNETSLSALPPSNSRATLTDSDVLSAEVVSNVNGYTVKFTLRDEHVSNSGMPELHMNCLPKLEMDMSDSSLKIESYDVLFSGSTITARYDNSGKLVFIEHIARSPSMTCTGSAVISLHVSMQGNITTTYAIDY